VKKGFDNHTGNKPMKKDHTGGHPERDGSKLPRAKEAGRRPAAALTDKHSKITLNDSTQQDAGSNQLQKNVPMMPKPVQQAHII
jgi:hypothetical protein